MNSKNKNGKSFTSMYLKKKLNQRTLAYITEQSVLRNMGSGGFGGGIGLGYIYN